MLRNREFFSVWNAATPSASCGADRLELRGLRAFTYHGSAQALSRRSKGMKGLTRQKNLAPRAEMIVKKGMEGMTPLLLAPPAELIARVGRKR